LCMWVKGRTGLLLGPAGLAQAGIIPQGFPCLASLAAEAEMEVAELCGRYSRSARQ
jgi:hypothetical protein